jgi:hypothetical protein
MVCSVSTVPEISKTMKVAIAILVIVAAVIVSADTSKYIAQHTSIGMRSRQAKGQQPFALPLRPRAIFHTVTVYSFNGLLSFNSNGRTRQMGWYLPKLW